eukprot:SAG22_NODE_3973_length_1443_cov_1.001488_1_plen_231_part_10
MTAELVEALVVERMASGMEAAIEAAVEQAVSGLQQRLSEVEAEAAAAMERLAEAETTATVETLRVEQLQSRLAALEEVILLQQEQDERQRLEKVGGAEKQEGVAELSLAALETRVRQETAALLPGLLAKIEETVAAQLATSTTRPVAQPGAEAETGAAAERAEAAAANVEELLRHFQLQTSAQSTTTGDAAAVGGAPVDVDEVGDGVAEAAVDELASQTAADIARLSSAAI